MAHQMYTITWQPELVSFDHYIMIWLLFSSLTTDLANSNRNSFSRRFSNRYIYI